MTHVDSDDLLRYRVEPSLLEDPAAAIERIYRELYASVQTKIANRSSSRAASAGCALG